MGLGAYGFQACHSPAASASDAYVQFEQSMRQVGAPWAKLWPWVFIQIEEQEEFLRFKGIVVVVGGGLTVWISPTLGIFLHPRPSFFPCVITSFLSLET